MKTEIFYIDGELAGSFPSETVKIKIKDKIVKVIKDKKVWMIPFTSILKIEYPKPPGAKAYFAS